MALLAQQCQSNPISSPNGTNALLAAPVLQAHFIDGREREAVGGSKGFVSGLRKSLNLRSRKSRHRCGPLTTGSGPPHNVHSQNRPCGLIVSDFACGHLSQIVTDSPSQCIIRLYLATAFTGFQTIRGLL
jgi:hypothetical protein